MQKFTYHTHNNALGIYDGRAAPDEMISRAEELGFSAIGVSNHLIWHPNMSHASKMFFQDWNKALDVAKRGLDGLREAAQNHNIKVACGFEVDFFPSATWRNGFEKMLKELDVDYLIGSTHSILTSDEEHIYNIYHLEELPLNISNEEKDELLKNYWNNVIGSIKSGYFDFIAHLDYCTQFNLCTDDKWRPYKESLIEALDENRQAYEINTGGYRKLNRPFPDIWIIKELCKRNGPVLISDDAHYVEHIGSYFDDAESLLESLNYKNRWTPKNL